MENSLKSWSSLEELKNMTFNTTILNREQFSFVWRIEQFSNIMSRKYEFSSPIFYRKSAPSLRWKMVVFPENIYPEGEHVALRLIKAFENNESYSTVYTISVVDGEDKCFPRQNREKVFRQYLDFDECVVISNNEMKEKKLLTNGTLTIKCKMDIISAENPQDSFSSLTDAKGNNMPITNDLFAVTSKEINIETPRNIDKSTVKFHISRKKCDKIEIFKNVELLSNDFKSLYVNKDKCDVTVRVDDGCIRAHTAILATRSDYFRQAFNNISQVGNEIFIPGIDSIILDAILYYLYTGHMRQLAVRNAIDLLKTCQKLHINCLEEMTKTFLKTEINVNSVMEVFQAAKDLNMDSLKICALKFITANHVEVAKTEKWIEIVMNDPHTAGELFLSIASYQKNQISKLEQFVL